MSDTVRFLISLVLTGLGLFCLISSVVGVFRFRGALNRIHAAALMDTVGMLFMVGGVIVAEGPTITSLKLLAVILFLWVTSPVSSHLIGRLEITTNDALDESMDVLDPEAVRREKEGN